MNKKITASEITKMDYVDLMAFLKEANRPPGGKNSIRIMVQNCFIDRNSKILDVGCNTGYCSFEIAHLTRCSVVGIDVNSNMIATAEEMKKKDPLSKLIKFQVADAMNMPFKDESFDVVMSGGSTAFVQEKRIAIKEYARVVKLWGFIADINFYYRVKPSASLIKRLNNTMNINIEPWGINYWLKLYESQGLENYFIFNQRVKTANPAEIKKYCQKITADIQNLSMEDRNKLRDRLIKIMRLFNENHRYLNYCVFIMRKKPNDEQISLFGV